MNNNKLYIILTLFVLLTGCTSLPPNEATMTPTNTPSASVTATVTPVPTATQTPTPTITPSPTPTPMPDALLDAADLAYHNGDWANAQSLYEQLALREGLTPDQHLQGTLGLAQAYLAQGDAASALITLAQLDVPTLNARDQARALILQGDAYLANEDFNQAADSYAKVAEVMPVLSLNALWWVGDAHYAAGEFDLALPAYEQALTHATVVSDQVGLYERIGLCNAALGNYEPAMAAYDAILSVAQVGYYRARIMYQAAQTALLFGEYDAGYDRMYTLIATYPDEDYAYEALVDLVEADMPVDNWLRGYIDYQAEAYSPAVQALYNAINEDPQHTGAPHYYIGLSYMEAGSSGLAQQEFQTLINTHPDDPYWNDAWLGLAEAYIEAGDSAGARDTYRALIDDYPQDPLVPVALWDAATMEVDLGNFYNAAMLFTELADNYPNDDGAPEARFKAGLLHYREDDFQAATDAWQALIEWYPYDERSQAAMFWMGKTWMATGNVISATESLNEAVAFDAWSFYGLRASDLLINVSPFTGVNGINWTCDTLEARVQAENWLAEWLELETSDDLYLLSEPLSNDPRLIRGTLLLQAGHFDEGRTELEDLRRAYSINAFRNDALRLYQLAHYFRDIGLYRSSIVAATTLWSLSPAEDITALPRYIGCMIYPTYYSDLLLPEAENTGLDPLFAFALLRQESLFEGYATSFAAAHGLMQVIPPTGAQIAAALNWPPDYETSDLYRPMVSVHFGIWYLTQQRDTLDGELFAAMAAYNGGPGNAAYWWQQAEYDRDLFVELIGFYETRTYVRRIKEHYAKYVWLYSAQ